MKTGDFHVTIGDFQMTTGYFHLIKAFVGVQGAVFLEKSPLVF